MRSPRCHNIKELMVEDIEEHAKSVAGEGNRASRKRQRREAVTLITIEFASEDTQTTKLLGSQGTDKDASKGANMASSTITRFAMVGFTSKVASEVVTTFKLLSDLLAANMDTLKIQSFRTTQSFIEGLRCLFYANLSFICLFIFFLFFFCFIGHISCLTLIWVYFFCFLSFFPLFWILLLLKTPSNALGLAISLSSFSTVHNPLCHGHGLYENYKVSLYFLSLLRSSLLEVSKYYAFFALWPISLP